MATVAPLPTGTVTFLFTDIEGSTRLWEQHPEAMRHALARHDALVQDAILAHGGHVFKTIGDQFCAAFSTAPEATAAAIAAQQALHAEPWEAIGPLRTRMALHTGTAEQREGDYFGPPVNRVARLLEVGHGDQILLSQAAYELVRDHLPDGASLVDRGEHRLKDLVRPERIFQLVLPDLPVSSAPLQSLDARPNNLPVQPTPLLGREKELAATQELLQRDTVRLLTLTGPSGTGKTRLSLQLAAELLDKFAGGVFVVLLASISDPALVAPTIAQTIGVREAGGRPLMESLQQYLKEKQLLLLLDNFEQVLPAAPVVAELLGACPHIKVLVTSRAALHLRGEQEVPVPPLALPDRGHLPPLERLSQYAAVELFIQRAQAVRPDFEVTNESAPAVAEICHRLDGLPLAIELAAAWIRLLSPPVLLSRLERRLPLLMGGAPDLPARQQTLRGAIAWSYDLLPEGEQRLFARLSVFVGGCTLAAAEAVCGASGDPETNVLSGLASLVDKNLVRPETGPEKEPRFTMLETIREYGQERLQDSGEAEAVRRQHARYFLGLAERAEPELRGPDQAVWLNRLEAEYHNLRVALEWSVRAREVELGLRLAAALKWFWQWRGHHSEVRERLAELLVLARESRQTRPADSDSLAGGQQSDGEARRAEPAALQPADGSGFAAAAARLTAARARGLSAAGALAWDQGSWHAAVALFEEGLALFRQLGDRRGVALALASLGGMSLSLGDPEAARVYLEESLALSHAVGDRQSIRSVLGILADAATYQGDYATARAHYQECLGMYREPGDQYGIAWALNSLGQVAQRQGDLEAAQALHEESLAISRAIASPPGISWSLQNLGHVARARGDLETARSCYEQCLALCKEPAVDPIAAWPRFALGRLMVDAEAFEAARALLEETLATFREWDDPRGTAHSLFNLGRVSRAEGDPAAAAAQYSLALPIFGEMNDRWAVALMLEEMGALAVSQGRAERAARLLGAAEALRDAIGSPLPPIDQPGHDQLVAAVRAALGEALFATAWAEGRAMPLEDAVAMALEERSDA